MKFGLIIPDSKKKATASSSSATTKVQPSKAVASIFAADEDDEEESELAELRKAHQARQQPVVATASISSSNNFVEKLHTEALQEDPNIFDYDASLEAESNVRKNVHRNLRILGKEGSKEDSEGDGPKYMHTIIAKAEERKIESELIKLRNMKRKSDAMGSSASPSEEVFITSAYSQRLKDLEAKEKELKARRSREEDGDVSKRKDMSGFYFNLMKRNVSFGGKPREVPENLQEVIEAKKIKTEEVKESSEENIKESSEENIKESSEEKVKESSEEDISFGPRRPPNKK